MAGISSLGVGSGLDLNSLVRQLVAAERAPADARLNRLESRVESQISGLGQVKSSLAKLEEALARLTGVEDARSVRLSDETAFSATATAAADVGRYNIEVFELARAQSLASLGFADPDAPLGAGDLTISLGAGDPVTVTIAEGANSLRDVRDAINGADAGVLATLVRDGAEWRLLLSAEESGLANTVSVSVSGSLHANLASAAMTETVTPADARFSVAGLELTSSSNVVDDVLPGVTLNLRRITEAPVELAVGRDAEATRAALDEFVTAYNAMIDLAASLSSFNTETGTRAALNGDSTLRAIRGALPAALGADTGAGWNAVELGLRSDRNGKLSVDDEAFAARLAENPAQALASLRGFGEALAGNIGIYTDTGGVLATRTESLQSSLRSLELRRDQLDRRMESVEARLVRQFTALDQMISQMQNTSSFLASRLATLPVPGA
ncbi:MAG TPA: flagellar filament capping protein FliD [Gammaproteobacteria bacterium]|nr:flagellar filament capping protein FliD [Gammaproteobacteria bacterium]HRP86777.1 flagellar filament capping protein FliD [Gammaproteobacteria bacterium]